MNKGKTRTVKFIFDEIKNLPKDKPVVYKILDKNSENIYTGVAKRGRINDRLKEHLPKGPHPIPGNKVQIQQKESISEAEKTESIIISRSKPRYNVKGK